MNTWMNPADANTGVVAEKVSPEASEKVSPEVSAEVLATLAEIGEEVNASLDLDEVLARTAALIKRHIDYEIFGVLMFEGDAILPEAPLLHRVSAGAGGQSTRSARARNHGHSGGDRSPRARERHAEGSALHQCASIT